MTSITEAPVVVVTLHASTTQEKVDHFLKIHEEAAESPFKQRVYKIQRCLFACCGTNGMGIKNRGSLKAKCKSISVKYASRALSGIATAFLTVCSGGYYAYVEYKGYKAEQKRMRELSKKRELSVIPAANTYMN